MPGEGQVAGLFGHVDAHDPLQERMHLVPAAERLSLDVVDGVLPTEHEHEEQRREAPAEEHHAAGAYLDEPGHALHVDPAAVYELLEHQTVLGLLDDLVVGVAELARLVRQPGRELEQAAFQDALELQADLHLAHDHVQPQTGPHPGGLVPVPGRGRQGLVRPELPTGVGRIDAVVLGVPRDVREGVEVLARCHRLAAETVEQRGPGVGPLLVGCDDIRHGFLLPARVTSRSPLSFQW